MLAWALVSLVAAWLLQRRSTAADTEPAEPEPTDPADPAEPAERPERG
jgi:hypothetical protein